MMIFTSSDDITLIVLLMTSLTSSLEDLIFMLLKYILMKEIKKI